MTLTCLQRLCCLNAEDEYSDKRPEIVVISSQPDKDTSSIPDSFVSSSVVTGKFDKAGSRGSVSEEDSGVGSCRDTSNQSDAADQTDTSSQSEDTVSTKLRRSDSTLSSMSAILPTKEHELDLTAEIAAELEQMNGFSLEASNRTVLDLDLPNRGETDAKKKRKRRKHRKITKATSETENDEVKEF